MPNAPVQGLKAQAGFLAHEFYGRPSESLWVCGVTGTNGKTSCTHWLAHLLALRNTKSAVIGTLGSGFRGSLAENPNTTPDALELHRMLYEFRTAGAGAVALEVSSHGLDQGRVNGVEFDCALFTNLTHDHLDYHGSMAAYAQAKARLFDAPGLGTAVLNLDDPLGAQIARRLTGGAVRTIGYALSAAAVGEGVGTEFLAATHIEGDQVTLASSWGSATVTIPQLGRFNVANALGVLGCLLAYGIPFEEGAALLAKLPSVPGRMQRIAEHPAQPLVVVDYAHTPDALDKVLATLRPLARARGGQLVAVFGAGGGRDASKRPEMGMIVSVLADRVILTSDNPRDEDPNTIIEAIRHSVSVDCLVEADRARAIETAIASAAPADVVLIAGKGHENFQEIAGRRLPFSDALVAEAALGRRAR